MEILMILIWILFAWWNVSIARKNGRNTIWAAIWGLLLGLLSIVIYALMGKTRQQEIIDFEYNLAMANRESKWHSVSAKKAGKK